MMLQEAVRRLPCGDVTWSGTCGYHAVILHWSVRAVTMR
jgi:hypothetical protein